MLLLFLIRVAEWSPVWERAIHSVYCACLSWAFFKFCVCPSFPFGIEGRMSDVIVLIPDHCLSIYFTLVMIIHNKLHKLFYIRLLIVSDQLQMKL